jgi:hypothetical protein
MRYLLVIALGGSLVAAAVQSLKEVRSAESERDMWRNLYLIERRAKKTCIVEFETVR